MSLPITLAAIGDDAILTSNLMEQVAALYGAAHQVDNATATRTYTIEFRVSTDGVTFGAWMTFDEPTITALVLDANDQFYWNARVTRTGSDATGVLIWSYFGFQTTTDDQATTGRGLVSLNNAQQDIIDLFKAIIQSWVWQENGGDHYEVHYKPRDWEYTTRTIYMHSLTPLDSVRRGSLMQQNYQISMGIKPVKGKTEGYSQQWSRLMNVFSSFAWALNRWTFTYKEVVYTDVNLFEYGLREMRVSGNMELHDKPSNMIYNEWTVEFSLNFNYL